MINAKYAEYAKYEKYAKYAKYAEYAPNFKTEPAIPTLLNQTC